MRPSREQICRINRTGLALLGSAVTATHAFTAQVDPARLPPPASTRVDFVREIQPLLAQHCYSCHGPDQSENDLRWDVKSAALKGGSSGPAIVPGHSAESRMIQLVAGLEKNLVMPKKGDRLTPDQIGLLRAWIDQGAAWPDEPASAKSTDKSDWWSFQPATRPPLPKVKSQKWTRNPIDRFHPCQTRGGRACRRHRKPTDAR